MFPYSANAIHPRHNPGEQPTQAYANGAQPQIANYWRTSTTTKKEPNMNNSTVRIGLAAVVAFYVIVTSLFLQAYIPLNRFYAHAEAASHSSRQEMSNQQMQDALSYTANEMKVRRYGSILLWGTVGIATFGGVFVATRQKNRREATLSDRGNT